MPAAALSRLLIVHPGALGDVLQAIPALRALRAAGAGRERVFAGQDRLGHLLLGLGEIDAALSFDRLGLEALFAGDEVPATVRERLGRVDRIVSWFGARAEPYPRRLAGLVPCAIVASPVPPAGARVPVWEHLVATLSPWGIARAHAALGPVAVPEGWRVEARERLAGLGIRPDRPLLVAHPGAGGIWKRWAPGLTAEAIARAVEGSGAQVLLHRGPADGGAVSAVQAELRIPATELVEPPLELLAGVLATAAAYLGPDSGVSHLAASVGAPALILFPPSTAEAWRPWSRSALPLVVSGDPAEMPRVAQALAEPLGR